MSDAAKDQKKQSDRWFPVFCTVMLVLLLLNAFVIKLAVVDGRSMYPTLHDRELLLVFRPGYQPARGDVVVIHTGEHAFSREYIVKRVIAVAGETVQIDYDTNTAAVDGTVLEEPYLNYEEDDAMLPRDARSVVACTVPEGTVFVLGDNRNHSADSRSEKYGMISENRIVGKVIYPSLS